MTDQHPPKHIKLDQLANLLEISLSTARKSVKEPGLGLHPNADAIRELRET